MHYGTLKWSKHWRETVWYTRHTILSLRWGNCIVRYWTPEPKWIIQDLCARRICGTFTDYIILLWVSNCTKCIWR